MKRGVSQLLVWGILLAGLPAAFSQDLPVPISVPGTPTCSSLKESNDAAFSDIRDKRGLRVSRTTTPLRGTLRLSNAADGKGGMPGAVVIDVQGDTVNWSSNRPVTTVIVQGGKQANVYSYNPASTGGYPNGEGTGLLTGNRAEVGQLTFCFDPTPIAARVSVSGRVVDAVGRPIGGAELYLTDPQTSSVLIALTNADGSYSIPGARAGGFYMLNVSHKRYAFSDNVRALNLSENVSGIDFTADF